MFSDRKIRFYAKNLCPNLLSLPEKKLSPILCYFVLFWANFQKNRESTIFIRFWRNFVEMFLVMTVNNSTFKFGSGNLFSANLDFFWILAIFSVNLKIAHFQCKPQNSEKVNVWENKDYFYRNQHQILLKILKFQVPSCKEKNSENLLTSHHPKHCINIITREVWSRNFRIFSAGDMKWYQKAG